MFSKFIKANGSRKYHLLFWSIFIMYEIGVSYTFSGSLSNIFDYAGHFALNISLFYFHAYQTLNTSFRTKTKFRYLILVTLILVEIGAYLLAKYLMLEIFQGIGIPVYRPFIKWNSFVIEGGWRAIYFLVLSSGYWFALSTLKQQEKITDLNAQRLRDELEKQRLENAYLQSQINPHFLFNTLTFLYTSVNRISEKVADSVLLLADVMRYSLKRPNEDGKTCIAEEIEHIQNFIELNQAQTDYPLQLDFQAEGDYKNLRILPLVMLTLVENVFKYGDLKNPEDPAKIYIQIQGKELSMYICNKVKASHRGHSHSLGMENVIKRLDNYYNGRYILNVNTKENHYYLNLAITL